MQTCCNDFVLLVAVSPLADDSNYVQREHFTSVTIINVDLGINYIKSSVQSALRHCNTLLCLPKSSASNAHIIKKMVKRLNIHKMYKRPNTKI